MCLPAGGGQPELPAALGEGDAAADAAALPPGVGQLALRLHTGARLCMLRAPWVGHHAG